MLFCSADKMAKLIFRKKGGYMKACIPFLEAEGTSYQVGLTIGTEAAVQVHNCIRSYRDQFAAVAGLSYLGYCICLGMQDIRLCNPVLILAHVFKS